MLLSILSNIVPISFWNVTCFNFSTISSNLIFKSSSKKNLASDNLGSITFSLPFLTSSENSGAFLISINLLTKLPLESLTGKYL